MSFVMQDKILQVSTASEIIKAIEANFLAYGTTQFARWSRIEVHDEPHLLWFKCDVPSPMFNVVQRARLSPDNVDHIIAEQQARYAERNLPILWWTSPSSTPLEISHHLTSAGFEPSGELTGMAINLQNLAIPPHPENLIIEPTAEPASLVTFAHTLCQGFQVPQAIMEPMIDQALAMDHGTEGPLINYVGSLNGLAVATSSLYLGSGVAGIYNVSTMPAVRRRGIGTAITMAPLLEAKKRGYRFAILHASRMAFPIYQKLGFETYCYFHQYLWSVPDQKKTWKIAA